MSQIVLSGPATDLSVLGQLTPADLFAQGGTAPVYEAISKEVAAFIADPATEEGRKEIKSMAMKIAKSKTFLDEVGKTFNADLKEKTRAVDAERRDIWDKLEALQHEIRRPVTEWEGAEEARVQGHKDAMVELESLIKFDGAPTIEVIRERMHINNQLHARDWAEFDEMARQLFESHGRTLVAMLETAQQAERDRLELEALRAAKLEQEAKDAEEARAKAYAEEKAHIEREAAEKATRDAEAAIQAEKDKAAKAAADAAAALKASEEKAARDKAEADKRIKNAEEARIAAEAKVKAETELAVQREKDRAALEKKREEEEAQKRENDRTHHARINNEVLAAIVAVDPTISNENAKAVTVAIASGKIPHIKIFY